MPKRFLKLAPDFHFTTELNVVRWILIPLSLHHYLIAWKKTLKRFIFYSQIYIYALWKGISWIYVVPSAIFFKVNSLQWRFCNFLSRFLFVVMVFRVQTTILWCDFFFLPLFMSIWHYILKIKACNVWNMLSTFYKHFQSSIETNVCLVDIHHYYSLHYLCFSCKTLPDLKILHPYAVRKIFAFASSFVLFKKP